MGIAAKHLSKQPESIVSYSNYSTDPRPDIKIDHLLWNRLLRQANQINEELAMILHGLRCGGTRIRKVKGWYVLRPDVDPAGKVAWEKKEDYEQLRDKYLKPHLNVVIELMKKLTREVAKNENRSA